MKSAISRRTVEKIVDYVRPFVGSTGAGQYSFQLLCGQCNRQDAVSSSKIKIDQLKFRKDAALRLIEQGWSFSDRPRCPECLKAP